MPARVGQASRKASKQRIDRAVALVDELKKHQVRVAVRPEPPSLADVGAADVSPVPLALLGRRGVILSAAASLFKLLEAEPDQVLYKSLADFLSAADASVFYKFLLRCEGTRQTRRAEFVMGLPARPAKNILLILAPAADVHRAALFRAAFVDLSETEPRDFGRAARQDTRLIETIDGIVWEADYPRRFTFVSRQVERILGFPAEDWLRDPDFWERHIYQEDRERVVHSRAQALRQAAPHVLEYRMVTAGRKVIWVKDSAVVLGGAPGWTRMCGIITDITDLEEARLQRDRNNEELEAAVRERTARMEQSLEAMETLCYGIAHDLKAPLRGLQGFISLLTADYQTVFDDTARMYATRCQAALRRMGDLIDAVLAYGRLNHTLPDLVPVGVRSLLDRLLATMDDDIRQHCASVHLQASLPCVIGNPQLLEQAFTNLLSNALKFSRPGVPPEISFTAVQTDRGTARLIVSDNGIGVAPEFIKRMYGMFQKFHAAKDYPGTGIGLAIVKRAVELMNGQVGVISDPGHGSSFWIELPLPSGST